jgi:hypothetical protein
MPSKGSQQAHHIVVIFFRWRDADHDPVVQIRISTIEQSFKTLELREVEISEISLGKSAEYEIAFLCSPMPAPEQQPLASEFLDAPRVTRRKPDVPP